MQHPYTGMQHFIQVRPQPLWIIPVRLCCRYDLANYAAAKVQFQLGAERGMSQGMFDLDLKGKDWNGQLKYGTSNFYGANYFQSVTPHLAIGGEVFYLSEQRRSGEGLGRIHFGGCSCPAMVLEFIVCLYPYHVSLLPCVRASAILFCRHWTCCPAPDRPVNCDYSGRQHWSCFTELLSKSE
jgi:hypothetical protein